MRHSITFLFLCLFSICSCAAPSTWRGLSVELEHRCTLYDKKEQYPYPQSVEDEIVASMGGVVYGPYTGSYFDNDGETDIEHIVAASEGHDSGLCSASANKRRRFATDLLNLTLASPKVNRCSFTGKCGKDAAEWMPSINKCWFAERVRLIKTKYDLSVDQAEADSLEAVLSNCPAVGFEMQMVSVVTGESSDALEMYDRNKNGRITCSEARAAEIVPVRRGHPAYEHMRDGDGDGVVCE